MDNVDLFLARSFQKRAAAVVTVLPKTVHRLLVPLRAFPTVLVVRKRARLRVRYPLKFLNLNLLVARVRILSLFLFLVRFLLFGPVLVVLGFYLSFSRIRRGFRTLLECLQPIREFLNHGFFLMHVTHSAAPSRLIDRNIRVRATTMRPKVKHLLFLLVFLLFHLLFLLHFTLIIIFYSLLLAESVVLCKPLYKARHLLSWLLYLLRP
mmetsp:Transcript_35069/g.82588  ORF Transcript_35069/g.82588 Transcript_35069/m.82588 type:complete len:208 (+) Transcript_35069:614-1237(+)